MPFDAGTISFTICKLARDLPDEVVDGFAAHAARSLETVTDEPRFGWVTGRHLLDTNIEEHTAKAGGHLHLCLQSAVRRIPSSLFKAECRIRELAYMADKDADFVPRKVRQEIKDEVTDFLLPDMPPTVSGIPFVVDQNRGLMYLGATSVKQVDTFLEHFYEAQKIEPVPLTPEFASEIEFGVNPDTFLPMTFSPEVQLDPDGYFGRDFLTWIWYYQDTQKGTFEVGDLGEFGVMIDGPLTFAAEGPGALESVARKGTPTRSAEAKAAMSVGKRLRLASVIIARDQDVWTCTLDADTFAFKGMKLPDTGEALDSDSRFMERVMQLDIFRQAFFALYKLYVEVASDKEKSAELAPKLKAWVQDLGNR
ncbi:MAG TPA: hypothetical protein DCR55_12780 [Lentisphaeria bacterium]|jgi:hypothetical protein|nr:hypothetical protein [Lentisphaeria bacterium]